MLGNAKHGKLTTISEHKDFINYLGRWCILCAFIISTFHVHVPLDQTAFFNLYNVSKIVRIIIIEINALIRNVLDKNS